MFKIAEEDRNKTGIYKIAYKEDLEKFYIGSSRNIYRRATEHYRNCMINSKCPYFYNAMKKHGRDNFIHTILEIADPNISDDDLSKLEQKYFDLLKPVYNAHLLAGRPPLPKTTPITQYDLNKIRIRDFDSIMDAEYSIGIKNVSMDIGKCCDGLLYSVHGRRYAYFGESLKEWIRFPRGVKQKVYIKNKNLYLEFDSLTECALYLNINRKNMHRYVRRGYSKKYNIEIGRL